MFPSTQIIFSKHCAIICLNNKYSLENASITRDEKCIAATILDDQNTPIISITTYVRQHKQNIALILGKH
jgi:hypothetical protein